MVLLNNLVKACQLELSGVQRRSNISKDKVNNLLTDMNGFAAQLGEQWRAAVPSAVQNS